MMFGLSTGAGEHPPGTSAATTSSVAAAVPKRPLHHLEHRFMDLLLDTSFSAPRPES
jgi:hypothetical protein